MSGLGLARGDVTLAIIHGSRHASRGEILALSEIYERGLRALGARSAVTITDDPVRLLAAIDAAARAGTDLYLAHTALPLEHVRNLVTEARIGAQIDDHEIAPTGVAEVDSSGTGAIHLMTSGTSGRPKIAVHTLETLLTRILAARRRSDGAGERWLLTFQSTGFAGVQVLLNAVSSNAVTVVPVERTPVEFHRAAVAAGVTHVSGTPTFWRSLLMLLHPGELELRQVTLGGEGADQAILDRLRHFFPRARITHTYASTEAGVVFAVHDGQVGFPAAWLDTSTQGVELRIRDGYLQIRSPSVMRRYVSGSTEILLNDGWFASSDRCEISGDRVLILGRDDAMINVAGSKVYPAAVEAVLLSLAEVAEARVYGVPNPISGALVAADVVLAVGQDPASSRAAINAACRQRLASYQHPRVLRVVDSIDVLPSGKKAIR